MTYSAVIPKVALWQPEFHQICRHSNLFSCSSSLMFKKASLLLKCMGLGNSTVEQVDVDVLHTKYFDDVFNQADILPYSVVIDEAEYFENYFVSRPIANSHFNFYTGSRTTSSTRRDWKFMLNPFSTDMWVATTVVAFLAYLAMIFARKFVGKLSVSRTNLNVSIEFLHDIAIAVSFGLYAANLKAVINVTKPMPDFRTTEELAELIRNNQKSLIAIASTDTYDYRVIKGEIIIDEQYPESFKKLSVAIKINPPVIVNNRFEVCKKLATSDKFVSISDVDLNEYCPGFCFRSVELELFPVGFEAYVLPKNSTWTSVLNLCVDFIMTFTTAELKRNRDVLGSCGKVSIHPDIITFYPLLGPFAFWLVGICFGSLCLAIELCKGNKKIQKDFKNLT